MTSAATCVCGVQYNNRSAPLGTILQCQQCSRLLVVCPETGNVPSTDDDWDTFWSVRVADTSQARNGDDAYLLDDFGFTPSTDISGADAKFWSLADDTSESLTALSSDEAELRSGVDDTGDSEGNSTQSASPRIDAEIAVQPLLVYEQKATVEFHLSKECSGSPDELALRQRQSSRSKNSIYLLALVACSVCACVLFLLMSKQSDEFQVRPNGNPQSLTANDDAILNESLVSDSPTSKRDIKIASLPELPSGLDEGTLQQPALRSPDNAATRTTLQQRIKLSEVPETVLMKVEHAAAQSSVTNQRAPELAQDWKSDKAKLLAVASVKSFAKRHLATHPDAVWIDLRASTTKIKGVWRVIGLVHSESQRRTCLFDVLTVYESQRSRVYSAKEFETQTGRDGTKSIIVATPTTPREALKSVDSILKLRSSIDSETSRDELRVSLGYAYVRLSDQLLGEIAAKEKLTMWLLEVIEDFPNSPVENSALGVLLKLRPVRSLRSRLNENTQGDDI